MEISERLEGKIQAARNEVGVDKQCGIEGIERCGRGQRLAGVALRPQREIVAVSIEVLYRVEQTTKSMPGKGTVGALGQGGENYAVLLFNVFPARLELAFVEMIFGMAEQTSEKTILAGVGGDDGCKGALTEFAREGGLSYLAMVCAQHVCRSFPGFRFQTDLSGQSLGEVTHGDELF